MALIKCPECGKEISDTCDQCIHCGYKLKNETKPINQQNNVAEQPRRRRRLPTWAIILIVLGSIPIVIAILAPLIYLIGYLQR